MTSKEKLALLKETWYDVDFADEKYIDFNEEELFNDLEKDLELLEEMRNDFKILDWGEGFQYRYEFIYVNRYKFFINKEQYIKWSRLLNEE